jgi:hypothetical protein
MSKHSLVTYTSFKDWAKRIIPAVYLLYGLIDLSISFLSSPILIHMFILGVICLAAGASIWVKKAWSIYLVAFVGPLTSTVGIATLYSSIGFNGFVSSLQAFLFNLSLVCYSVVALSLSIYILIKRSIILGS